MPCVFVTDIITCLPSACFGLTPTATICHLVTCEPCVPDRSHSPEIVINPTLSMNLTGPVIQKHQKQAMLEIDLG